MTAWSFLPRSACRGMSHSCVKQVDRAKELWNESLLIYVTQLLSAPGALMLSRKGKGDGLYICFSFSTILYLWISRVNQNKLIKYGVVKRRDSWYLCISKLVLKTGKENDATKRIQFKYFYFVIPLVRRKCLKCQICKGNYKCIIITKSVSLLHN